MKQRAEQIAEGVTLHLGDCRDILPTLGKLEAIVTDPPYGIGEHGGKERLPADRRSIRVFENLGWDKERPEKATFELMFCCSKHQIIWGGNYFTDYLPPSMGWLYWDKKMGGDFSDGELAFTSEWQALRSFSHWNKMQARVHPAEKPVELLKWCIQRLPDSVAHIADPFMGSGTTGIAAINLGRKFTGIEIEPKYFDMACRRIAAATKQTDLFINKPKPLQISMLDANDLHMTNERFAQILREWWRFNSLQHPIASWHDRENFIEERLPELLEKVRSGRED